MISFQSVSKRFADGTIAVADLDLDVGAGEVCVLVGPSGCGKTTTLRMINRMVEPSTGSIRVEGQDIAAYDPPRLRRRMGYVIQQTGLFPHRTVAQNIATIPRLVGWDKKRMRERVDELVDLVGLPHEVTDRYPHQLSGGQQQRVGVARALAVDPPIMLMDEPFAATDPITREHLQEEFLRLQREVRKTIVFVTHDIDEAIRMGDKIAILRRGGTLAQYASPEELLANPADNFVAGFLGRDRGLKRLSLVPVSELEAEHGPVVRLGDSTEHAIRVARGDAREWLLVLDHDDGVRGWTAADRIAGVVADGGLEPVRVIIRPGDSLRTALNAMITSQRRVAVRVDEDGRYAGLLTQEQLTRQLDGPAVQEPA